MPVRASLKAIVIGRVQGVYFRAFAAQKANGLGLTGYAKNLPDGSVEVVAEGEHAALTELFENLKSGPPLATVASTTASWGRYEGKYQGFQIRC